MRILKISMCCLVALAFITSCEKETEILPELQQKTQEDNVLSSIENEGMESNLSVEEILIESIGFKNNISSKTLEMKTIGSLEIYYDQIAYNEENCADLLVEDFEEADLMTGQLVSFSGPLDEFTNNGYFSPGEITSGVLFNSEVNLVNNMVIRDFSNLENQSNRASANFADDNLQINFLNENVTSVSMDVFLSYVSGEIEIEIYGNEGLLGSDTIYAEYVDGTFFGVISSEPISLIKFIAPTTVNDSYVWERIDNVAFGVNDYDLDGVSNCDDNHPYSNLNEYLNIEEFETEIENMLLDNGSTMMDKIEDLIAEINAEYDGENYDDLHKTFVRELSKLTYGWRKDRLISRRERSAISGGAWNSNIPYFDER